MEYTCKQITTTTSTSKPQESHSTFPSCRNNCLQLSIIAEYSHYIPKPNQPSSIQRCLESAGRQQTSFPSLTVGNSRAQRVTMLECLLVWPTPVLLQALHSRFATERRETKRSLKIYAYAMLCQPTRVPIRRHWPRWPWGSHFALVSSPSHFLVDVSWPPVSHSCSYSRHRHPSHHPLQQSDGLRPAP